MKLPLAQTLAILALCVAPLAHSQEIMEFGTAAPATATTKSFSFQDVLASEASGPKLNRPSNTDKQPITLDRALAKPDLLSLRPDLMSILPQEFSADDGEDPMVDGTAELALRAVQYLGIPYRRGGTGPASGFDCSGLVRFVFGEVLGLKLPHRAEEIVQMGQALKGNDLEPGDLVFYNTMGRRNSHVGIYLGDNRFVHAPSSGGVVRIESMNLDYWKKRFNGARRIDVAALSTR
jgi:cell wall-associated NlpC family hydrolase